MSAIVKSVILDVTQNYFKNQLNRLGPSNPYLEEYEDNGTIKTKKRPTPLGLSSKDEKILRKIMKRAYKLDKGFSVCGFRFGYTFLLGLIPVVGDILDALIIYLLILRNAKKLDLPQKLLNHLYFNNLLAIACGTIPIVGDFILAILKSNSRNSFIIEDYC